MCSTKTKSVVELTATQRLILLWGHPFSTYAKVSEKLTFLTTRTCAYQFSTDPIHSVHEDHPFSTYAKFSEKHVGVRIRGSEMLVFRKILRTY